MSKAIFLFTMKRFCHWVTLVVGGFTMLIFAVFFGTLQTVDTPLTHEIARSFLVGPIIPLLVSYTVISPQVAK